MHYWRHKVRAFLYENIRLFALDYGCILGRVVVESNLRRRLESPEEMESE